MSINSLAEYPDVAGCLGVKERCPAVLEEESSNPPPQTSHGLGSKVADQEVGLSVYEGHQLPRQSTVVLLGGRRRRRRGVC